MARAPSSPPPSPRSRILPRLAVGAGVALAFAVGRWSVAPPDAGPVPGPQRVSAASAPSAARDRPAPSVATVLAQTIRSAQPPAPAPSAAHPDRPEDAELPARSRIRAPLAPEVESRIHEEARAGLARLRPLAVASCWPRDGLPGGRRETIITYNVTFDPEGREIGRGMVEDRRAPAGEFARCLRRLQGTALSVSPTGTFVTVRLPVSYP